MLKLLKFSKKLWQFGHQLPLELWLLSKPGWSPISRRAEIVVMPSNQLQSTFVKGGHWRQPRDDGRVSLQQLPRTALDNEAIERAAKALFEVVFSSCSRLEWTNCDETTKEGFRREATAVIMAVWPNPFAQAMDWK